MFEGAKVIGVDVETTGLDVFTKDVRLVQVSDGIKTEVFDLWDDDPEVMWQLWHLMENPDVWKVGHNLSFDMKFLLYHFGWRVAPIFDTLIAAQVLEGPMPKGHYTLDNVAKRYINVELSKDQQKSNWSGKLSQEQLEYAANDVKFLVSLASEQKRRLAWEELLPTAVLEFRAVPAIVEMELSGMKIDVPAMNKLSEKTRDKMWQSELDFSDIVLGSEGGQMDFDFGLNRKPRINVGSPQQVKAALQKVGLDLPDTREDTLKQYKNTHPAIDKLLERRHSGQVYGFLKAYPKLIHPRTGRLHPSFIQIGPITGRMACSKPNVQQAPADPEFRSLFVANEDSSILSADFDGQEMRILAEFTGEPVLLEAFRRGDDLHKIAASLIYGKPVNMIDKSLRTVAKNLQFGILYGRGAKAFAADIGISIDRAQELIDTYFAAYPYVKRWIRIQQKIGEQEGFVRTLGGRRCYLNLASDTGAWRREAVNYPIQGSGADLMKASLVAVSKELRQLDGAKLIAAVHDEIVLECKDELVDNVSRMVTESMAQAGSKFVRSVPVLADVGVGKTWTK